MWIWGTSGSMRMILAIVALALLTSPVAPAASAATPALRLSDSTPLTLVGVRFKAREPVRIVVRTAGIRRVGLLRANASGSFTAVFTGLVVRDPCSLTAVASGSAGSKAILRLSERICPADG